MGHQLNLGNGQLGLPIGQFLIGGMDIKSPATRRESRKGYGIARPGVFDVEQRIADQDRDGVDAERLYPSVLFNVYSLPDDEIVHATFVAYNDWLAGYIAPAGDRLSGLGAVQLRDLDTAIAEMHRVKKMGFRGLCIPCTAPADLPYSDTYYDPFWAAAQEADMPLTMHLFTGATPNHGLPAWPAVSYPLAYMGIEVTVSTLIVTGVCERFPRLRFVPTEFETGWIATLLRRLDHSWHRGGGQFTPFAPLPKLPSHYWHQNFTATFEDDPIGVRTSDFIGVGSLMWGSDYPHGDSIFPDSQSILDELFEGKDDDRRRITVDNAIALYDLPFRSGE